MINAQPPPQTLRVSGTAKSWAEAEDRIQKLLGKLMQGSVAIVRIVKHGLNNGIFLF
jgi:hypothetical protein